MGRLGIFSYNYYTSLLTPLELESEHDLLGNQFANIFAKHILDNKYEQAKSTMLLSIKPTSCLIIDQQLNRFRILLKHKKYLMVP